MAKKMVDKVMRCASDVKKIRNIAICAHIDHGKTTLSDNLLAGAGMISKELAGKVLQLDFRPDEQARGITIDAAAVSMVHTVDTDEYLIHLLDTPGHVDFGGDVTRAMRAVDGCIVLVDAVEGVMPQTETVLRQALRERVKPVLFINKVDRLIVQQQLSAAQIQERFLHLIRDVNRLISQIAEQPYNEQWHVQVQNGSVAFGSALHTWALSLPYMQQHGLAFKDVIDAYRNESVKTFADKAPLHRVVLSMAVHHLPDPAAAQAYRIPKIWHGDVSSAQGRALLSCDSNGSVCFVVTKIIVDPQLGDLAAGRLFSGTLRHGATVWNVHSHQQARIQQLFIYNGAKRELIDSASAGNIVGIAGISAYPGDTISDREAGEPFERMIPAEPVITKSIEPRVARELPHLIEVLEQVQKEDPGIKVDINKETGEILISGMGELHLDVIENRIKTDKHITVITSPPIVVHRESVTHTLPVSGEGISPDKHFTFHFTVEPLAPAIGALLTSGGVYPGRVTAQNKDISKKLIAAGMESSAAEHIASIFHGNIFVCREPLLPSSAPLVLDMFEEVMRSGPLCSEPCANLLVTLVHYTVSADAENSPVQVYPAVRDGIRAAILAAGPVLLEPKQVMLFEAPEEYTGTLSKIVGNKRGQMIELFHEQGMVRITAKLPVSALFGFSSELRSATEGRATSAVVAQLFEPVAAGAHQKLIAEIRKRKGMY